MSGPQGIGHTWEKIKMTNDYLSIKIVGQNTNNCFVPLLVRASPNISVGYPHQGYQSLLKSLLAFLLRKVFELAHVDVRNWYLTCVLVGTCLWPNWNFVSLDQCGKIAPCHTLFFIIRGFLVKYIWRGQIWQQQNKYCNRLVGIPWRSAPNWWFIPAKFGHMVLLLVRLGSLLVC